jgi:hypothetical protein
MKTKVCIHRDCRFKGKPQPIDVFNRDKSRADGRAPYCRECRTRVAAARMKRDPSARERAKQATVKYRKTEYGQEKQKTYYLEHKDEYRAREKKRMQRPDVKAKHAKKMVAYRLRNPLKQEARYAIKYAVSKGRVPVPDNCEWCGKPANGPRLEAHHWMGYGVFRWFDVKFVHKKCHVECEGVSPDDWPKF